MAHWGHRETGGEETNDAEVMDLNVVDEEEANEDDAEDEGAVENGHAKAKEECKDDEDDAADDDVIVTGDSNMIPSTPRKRGRVQCLDPSQKTTPTGRGKGRGRVKQGDPFDFGGVKMPNVKLLIKRKLKELNIGESRLRLKGIDYCGLRNLGATCYINSLLQFLFMNGRFRSEVLAWPDEDQSPKEVVVRALRQLFFDMQETKLGYIDPQAFVDTLRVRTNQEQDVEEFRKLFFSHLQQCSLLKEAIPSMFAGKLRYVVKCHKCKKESDGSSNLVDFYELMLNMEKKKDLLSCVQELLAKEELTADNLYDCDNCTMKTEASKYVQIDHIPPILFFHIQRYRYDLKTFNRLKMSHAFKIPLEVDMDRVLKQPSDGQGGEGEDSGKKYQLAGVFSHSGDSATSGHYTVELRGENDVWWRFNDEEVVKRKAPTGRSMSSPEAYMVVYTLAEDPSMKSAGCGSSGSGVASGNGSNGASSTSTGAVGAHVPLPKSPPLHLSEKNGKLEDEARKKHVIIQEHSNSIRIRMEKHQQTVKSFIDMIPKTWRQAHDGNTQRWLPAAWLEKWMREPDDVKGVENAPFRCRCMDGLGKLNPAKKGSAKCVPEQAWNHLTQELDVAFDMPLDGPCSVCEKADREAEKMEKERVFKSERAAEVLNKDVEYGIPNDEDLCGDVKWWCVDKEILGHHIIQGGAGAGW